MSTLLVCCHESVISLEEVSKTKCSKWHEETIVKIEETDIVRNELYIKVSPVNLMKIHWIAVVPLFFLQKTCKLEINGIFRRLTL